MTDWILKNNVELTDQNLGPNIFVTTNQSKSQKVR